MMEAAHRARGIDGNQRSIIKKDHGEQYEFIMVLHINDLVRITEHNTNQAYYYRVQKLDQSNRKIALRLHTAAEIKDSTTGVEKSASTLMSQYKMRKIEVNAIGKLKNDKTCN